MKIITKVSLLVLITLFLICTSSCWDNRDLTKRTFIVGLGLDKLKDNKMQLTLQLIKSFSDGNSQEKSQSSDPSLNSVSIGDTLHEAVRNQFMTVNRKPFYSHIQIIIIGEELAKDGINDVLDFFERDHETKLTPTILIAKGTTANEVLNIKSNFDKIPSFDIKEICQSSNVKLSILNTKLLDVLIQFSSTGRNTAIGSIEIIDDLNKPDEKLIRVDNAAVFKKDKLIGWLNTTQTIGFKYIINQMGSGIINIINPLDERKKIALEQTRVKSKIDVSLENNKLKLLVEVNSEGIIGNQGGTGDLSSQELIKKIEKRSEDVIKQQIKDVLKVTQKEYKSDIFGFSNTVHSKYIDYWNKVNYQWDLIFSNAPVEIKVNFKLNNSGIINKSVEVK